MMHTEMLIYKLFELGALKFGQFTLKNGQISPIYFDLRLAVSNPKLLAQIAEALYEKASGLQFDLICGVPYTAIPFATAMSVQHMLPMILLRKEKKEYGSNRLIDGIFEKNQKCLILEDVITSGSSIFETAAHLAKEGLIIEDAVVLVDREQGGKQFLEKKGFKVHAVCSISAIISLLLKEKKITPALAETVQEFIRTHQIYA